MPIPLLPDPGRLPQLPTIAAAAAVGAVVTAVASLDPPDPETAEVDPPVVEVEVALAAMVQGVLAPLSQKMRTMNHTIIDQYRCCFCYL